MFLFTMQCIKYFVVLLVDINHVQYFLIRISRSLKKHQTVAYD